MGWDHYKIQISYKGPESGGNRGGAASLMGSQSWGNGQGVI